jgi:hypothetical protein
MDESLELRLSLFVCLGLSAVYVAYAILAEPAGGQPFGHWLGIIGAVMMASTEVLYSLRKRTTWLRWAGPVRYWLSAHIFTGIVGPFMVLMHSAFEFRGLAGISMLLTVLVVASGFIGRYLYSAIPHSLAGAESSTTDLMEMLRTAETTLAAWVGQQSQPVQALVTANLAPQRAARGDWALVFLRGWDDWLYQASLRRQIRRLEKSEHRRLADVERLVLRHRARERQLSMMQAARRMLSVWHTIHVPMGLALFSSIAMHVVATLYFGAGIAR